jgi:poly-beta-1,6-N-acetyl-D-glucosamine synthase
MTNVLIIYFAIYTLGLGVIVFVGFYNQVAKEKRYRSEKNKINSKEVVVLIPFRNERHRISVLLNAIKELQSHPSKYIFIDDHSDDQTHELIQNELSNFPFEVLHLPEGITGKKQALRYAISHSTEPYVLTWDADVVPEPDYFEQLTQLGRAEMYVLPAVLVADTFPKRFFEIDVVLVNAVNTGLAGLTRPIMSSGANFFYERKAFHEADDFASHAHAASGDDTYLLRDFRLKNREVRLISDRRNAITTETPQSFREFIDQRLRWIGKTGDLKDNLSTFLALFQSLLSILYIVGLLFFAFFADWKLVLVLFTCKTFVDLSLLLPFFLRIQRTGTWLLIPVYELLFPFYNFLILILLPFYRPKWKGRGIYSKGN